MASIYDNVIITKLGGILIAAGKAIKEEVADPVDLLGGEELEDILGVWVGGFLGPGGVELLAANLEGEGNPDRLWG